MINIYIFILLIYYFNIHLQFLPSWQFCCFWQLTDPSLQLCWLVVTIDSFVDWLVQGCGHSYLWFSLILLVLQKSDMKLLVFVADNLSAFSYQLNDEPLFIMHQIEIIVSVNGGNLLQSFKEVSISRRFSNLSSRPMTSYCI